MKNKSKFTAPEYVQNQNKDTKKLNQLRIF